MTRAVPPSALRARLLVVLLTAATTGGEADAQVQPPAAQPGDTVDPRVEALMREAEDAQAPVRDLLAIYRRIEGLRDIRVHFEGGILEVAGTALDAESRATAVRLAEEVPGVVWVDNRITVETAFRRRLEPAGERLREKTTAFIRFVPTLGAGILVIGGSILLAVWLAGRSFPFDRVARNPFARSLLRQVTGASIVLMGVLLALDLMAATALVGAVLGAAGVLGIAVGFAFRDIVENYLAGVLLSIRQPFQPNDHIEMAGHDGRVVRLTGRETILMTIDGNHVRIPNATVFKAVTTNFTRNPRRRFVVAAGVAPWEDLSRALAIGREAVAAVPGVLEKPGPSARVHELADSSVSLRIWGWVDQSVTDFGKARSEAIRAVKEAYEREGIATPPPELGVRMLEGAPAPVPARTVSGADADSPRFVETPAQAAPDVSPDTTIEEEIAHELRTSDEENLLRPAAAPASAQPSARSAPEGKNAPPG